VCEAPAQSVLVAGPLYHNYGFMWSMMALTSGRHLVLMHRFAASELLRLVEFYRIECTTTADRTRDLHSCPRPP
jgi:acyl-CoA synthetase (AMP-forming)/AMP-acid ligase II